MSGGIKYRLTARERDWFADQLGVLEDLRARLQPSGIDAKLSDAELQVSAEQGPQGPEFVVEYPFDTDLIPNNGRIYVKDTFKLSKEADRIVSFDRTLRQDLNTNKAIRYWVEAARKDHPDAKINPHAEHLIRFLEDLGKLPKPALDGQPMQRFLSGVLTRLHRPFPPGNEELVRKNFSIFSPVLEKTVPFDIRMKFGDPQSGLSLRRDGDKLILSLQVVFDSDPKPGLEAEKNGRMFLIDSYEIDPATGLVKAATREVLPSEVRNPAFEKAYAAIKDSPAPESNAPALQALVTGWLKGLDLSAAPTPEVKPVSSAPLITEEPADAAGKLLFALYRFTERDGAAGKNFIQGLLQPGLDLKIPGVPPLPEMDRAALRDTLAWVLAGDAAKTEATVAAWVQGDHPLEPATRTVLGALAQYSRGELEDARTSLAALSEQSLFARRLKQAVEARLRQDPRGRSLEILKIAAAEHIEQANQQDKAWVKVFSDGISGDVSADPQQRRLAVLSFFKNFEATLREHRGDLGSALEATAAQGLYEKEVKAFLQGDATMGQLTALLDEPDVRLREEGLMVLARGQLLGKAKLPATAKLIAESLDPELPGAQDLKNWFIGKANLGQKVEMLMPAFVEEVVAPHTLLSMMAAGTLGHIAKATFFSRVGFQSRRLRWAAEAVSVGVEAPAFVFSEKIITSALHSPEGQWEKLPRDTLGALLAFGTLRGAGIASRRFNRFLADSKGLEAWAKERSRFSFAENWLPSVENFATTEGKYALLRRGAAKAGVPALNYLGKKGVSRTWVPGALTTTGGHVMGLGGLMVANSLTRFAGLRDPSQQGWTSDLVDDFLMYGHFLVAGHLAQRLGRTGIENRLAYLESLPVQAKPAKAKSAEKNSEARDSHPSEPPADSKPGEAAPKIDVPPELKEFGRSLRSWFKENLPLLGKLGRDLVEALMIRAGRKAKPTTPSPIAASPAAVETKIPPPPESVETGTASEAPPSTESRPSRAPTAPPSESTFDLESTPGIYAVLQPLPARVNFRRLDTEAPVGHKASELKVIVEVLGREEDLHFREGQTKQVLSFEAVLGREEIQNPPQSVGIDFGFPSTEGHIAPHHAKIGVQIHYQTRVEDKEARASVKAWEFRLEDLDSPTGTYLNGKRVTASTPLKDGDKIRLGETGQEMTLRLAPVSPEAFLVRPGIPLGVDKSSWTLGREHAGADLPDIRFPISDRDISRRQARILRNEDGQYYVQDLSWNGTRVNMRRVHGSQELRDGDQLQLGNDTELSFELPLGMKTSEPRSEAVPPLHPNTELPPPEQAKVHPAYRQLSPEALDAHISRLSSGEAMDLMGMLAGKLRLEDGRTILLSSLNTGWTLGHEGKLPANSHALQFEASPSMALHPAMIYLDGAGRFILRGMRPESSIRIQTRAEKFLPLDGQVHKPSALKQRVQGWTVLEGGERVHLGEDFFFDFWPGSPKSPYESPKAVASEVGTESEPKIALQAITPIQFVDGNLKLNPEKPIVIRSQSDVTEMQIRDHAERSEIEVLVPESLGKLHTTRLFQEDGAWKIRSEGGEGAPVVVNGMRLPAEITLDLLPDTTLQIGDLKIQILRP